MISNILKNKGILLYNVVILLITASIFFYFVFQYADDFPVFDDIEAFCYFLNRSLSSSFFEVIKMLFEPSGDHNIFLGRLFALIYYKLFGVLNFRELLILGNLSLAILVLVYAFIFRKFKLSFLFFPIITILCFNIQSHSHTSFFFITLIQFPLFFLAYLSTCLIDLKNRILQVVLFIILATILSFSHSSGFVIWISLALILFLRGYRKEFFFFSILALLFIVFYLKSGTHVNNIEVELGLGYFKNIAIGVFGYLGSFFDILPVDVFKNEHRAILPTIVGLGTSLILAFYFFKEFVFQKQINDKKKLRIVLWGALIYCYSSAMMVGIFRSATFPYHFLEISPHYRPIGAFYFSLFITYIISLNHSKLRSIFLPVTTFAVVVIFVLSTYLRVDIVHNVHLHNTVYAENQLNNGSGLTGSKEGIIGAFTYATLKESKEKNIFELKNNLRYKEIFALIDRDKNIPEIQFTKVVSDDLFIYFYVKYDNIKYNHTDNGLFLTLKSETNKWIFNFEKELRPQKNILNIPISNSYMAIVEKSLLDERAYATYVSSIKGNEIELFKSTDITID